MKKNIIIILSVFVSFSCKAQIVDRYDINTVIGEENGAYYKDVNNFRDQFVGTWVYTQGATQLTIMIQKRDNLTNFDGLNTFNEDVLIGEYRYVENGIEKINTLTNINTNYGNSYNENLKHNLFGDSFLRRSTSYPRCNECAPNEKRMKFSYSEPNYDGKGIANGHIVIRKFTENGLEKIKIWFYTSNQIVFVDSAGNPVDNPAPFKIPFGEYVLVKQ
ncbi:DUF6705 family protein [Flavobacterium sp.]|uniref:DUF6705 family protein n=1 Tax=Flavobacterium sp. TaxID=239 RepID=UPI004048B34A